MASSNIAVVAAHADDEVLECGGNTARLVSEGNKVHFLLLADGETSRESLQGAREPQAIERRNEAAHLSARISGLTTVEIHDFPDNRLAGTDLLDIVKGIEIFLSKYNLETVFTHHSGDANIDDRVAHDVVIAACRPQPNYYVKELLFFETLSSTEWRPPRSHFSFNPNWFVDISATLDINLNALAEYSDEMREFPHPRSIEGARILARWRGSSVGLSAAEAFVLDRKIN
jgi:LmbE family N-acetylglucosaminyl deacetylase